MTISARKITAFEKTVGQLADRPSLGSTALLKAQFDSSPEELRVALNGLVDDLTAVLAGASGSEQIGSAPIAGVAGGVASNIYAQIADIKAQLTGIVTGQIPDGSVTEAKLAFAIATQAELDAASIGSKQYAYRNLGGF